MSAAEQVRECLQALQPSALKIKDESHLHKGHAEAGNGVHLRLHIVSTQFAGLSAVKRHRLVYDSLGSLPALGVHALAITALTPAEDEK